MTLTSESDYQIASRLLFAGETGSDLTKPWQQLAWWFVTTYWMTLYDLGQVVPDHFDDNFTETYVAVSQPSTNNIFLNATLFKTYFNIWNTAWAADIPGINLNATNQFHANPTTFLQTYACVQRVPKPIVSIIINVLVADVSLTLAFYGFIVFVLEWVRKRHKDGDKAGEFPLIIKTHESVKSNSCVGHLALLDEQACANCQVAQRPRRDQEREDVITNSVIEVGGANGASNGTGWDA